MKKIFARRFIFSSILLLGAVFIALATENSHIARAQTSYALTGYAWSDNIGWISFSGSNPNYGITEDGSGNLNGYAWSDTIGWIKFGGLSGFPTGGGTSNENALISTTGTLHGWARACAGTADGQCGTMTGRTDGWDGWISLDGTNYGVNFASGNGQYSQSAYAWGSDVIGWLTFNPLNLTVASSSSCNAYLEVCGSLPSGTTPTATIYATPTSVASGTAATLSWNTTNITTCTKSSSGIYNPDPNWTGTLSSATSSGNGLTSIFASAGTETYTLSCTANAQAGGGQITAVPAVITVTGGTTGSGSNMCTSAPLNSTLCSGSATGSGASSLVSSCSATNGSPCQYVCSAGYHSVGNQCVGNGSIQEQ